MTSVPMVSVSATPSFGSVAPTLVVPANTTVTIKGVAKTITTASDCTVTEKTPPFTWTMQFQQAGGFPGPSPQPLSRGNTLTPTFNTGAQPGRFFVTLFAAGRLADVIIEVTSPRGPPWYSIGPDGSLATSVGRVNDIAADFSRPGLLYIAAGRGGIWATPDAGGGGWWPLTDHKGLPNLAMESVAVGPDGTVYAGTGDTRASQGLAADPGHGVFKSRDAGATWQPAGTQELPGCSAFTGAAERIVLDPRNASNVYLASSQGVFRSTSSGDCWTKIVAAPATDVALAPGDPTTLWVGAPPSGIVQIANAATTATVANTIPFVGKGEKWTRIVLAFSPVPNGKAFAVFATGSSATVLHTSTNWRSIDHAVQNDASGNALCRSQCATNTALAASPIQYDTAVYANVNHFETVDGGATWTSFRNDTIHSDARRLLYVPLPFNFPAGDPTASGAVYVGGANGLWRGLPSIDGQMIWQPVADVPDGMVLALSAHRTARATRGPLRANVYGRGVWEQMLTSPRCPGIACLKLGPVECLTCPSGAGPFPLTGNPVFSASLAAEFAVRYEYKGPATAGIFVRAVPLAGGVEPPQFIVEERPVQPGADVALVGVAYVASPRPLGVHTDQIRFEIVDDNKHVVLASQTAPFDHWWLRDDARLLTVDAVVADPSPRTLTSAPLTVTAAGQAPVRGAAPLRVPVPAGANVVVTARREVKVPGGVDHEHGRPSDEVRLALWRFNGRPAGTSASVTEAIWGDAYLAASYEVGRAHAGGKAGCDVDKRRTAWIIVAAMVLLVTAVLFTVRMRGRRMKP